MRREPWRRRGFPEAWADRSDLPLESDAQVAVVAHVYFPELLDEIIGHLASIPVAFDLIVTNASGVDLHVDTERIPAVQHVVVLGVENRGKDLWPLAQVVNAGLLDGYRFIAKVHTKRSQWRDGHDQLVGSGASWRAGLLRALLGNAENVTRILSAFATSPDLGMVTADGSVLGPEFWGGNEPVTSSLLRRLELDLDRDNLRFAAGSMYWTRGFILQGLRALNLGAADFEDEQGQPDATTAHALERVIGLLAHEAGMKVVSRSRLDEEPGSPDGWRRYADDRKPRPRSRLVTFYLPQFHATPENDRWWGAGFTDWTMVAAGDPAYPGHHQPRIPTSLGFYDLRLPQTVAAQAAMAESNGISVFVYFHYWFAGTQLLQGPIRARLRDSTSLPFALMWANEDWTRRREGGDEEILACQRFDEVPASHFIEDVIDILRDPRYMRVDGRALIAVHRPDEVPELARVVASWRESARIAGVGELLVLGMQPDRRSCGGGEGAAPQGLDGTLGFPPNDIDEEAFERGGISLRLDNNGRSLSYADLVDHAIQEMASDTSKSHYPGVMVAFDDTARRQLDSRIWYGSNPYTFRRWLAAAAAHVAEREPEHRVVFVNAWNEWADGAILEPTDRYGSTYLLAVRDVAFG